MKVLYFGDPDHTSMPVVSLPLSASKSFLADLTTFTFQESQALLNAWIVHLKSLIAQKKPHQYQTTMDSVLKDLAAAERMLAASETSPFEFTIVRDAKTLLEDTPFEDWFVIIIDLEHPQAREVIPELARRSIPQRFRVLVIVQESPNSYNNVDFVLSHGCRPWRGLFGPVYLLISLSDF